ncbi:hypothetical protein NDU88_010314 [Pleurodeles waltl]|uniref:Uncharacterized protein n=1 Tax=Pleurodeles waltl TaxID=8319 RepID=A0AAV7QU27_PLEWA|nr:hypothetical protein NDU88_010314 [Pleurodeles waltl]
MTLRGAPLCQATRTAASIKLGCFSNENLTLDTGDSFLCYGAMLRVEQNMFFVKHRNHRPFAVLYRHRARR